MNSGERRRIAAAFIAEHPESSLREIAQRAGVSPETARKVRLQLHRDEAAADARPKEAEQSTALQILRKDPALRSRENGRLPLRMLSAIDTLDKHGEQIIEHIPAHDLARVAGASRVGARVWEKFADLAEQYSAVAARNGRAGSPGRSEAGQDTRWLGPRGPGDDGCDPTAGRVVLEDGGQTGRR